MIALADDASLAARALAQEVYRDPDLRPAIDEPTARILAGRAPADDAPPKLKELAELRASLLRAGEGVASRRLLASFGTELSAHLVIAVSMDAGRPIARALRTSTASFERIELGATVETSPEGTKTYRWPGAAVTLRALLPGAVPLAPVKPLAVPPPVPEKPKESKPFYKSGWFWGTVGGVAATGLTVFILSRVTSSPGTVHLEGTVSP